MNDIMHMRYILQNQFHVSAFSSSTEKFNYMYMNITNAQKTIINNNIEIIIDIEYKDKIYGLYGSEQYYIDITIESIKYYINNITLNTYFAYYYTFSHYLSVDGDNNKFNYTIIFQFQIQ